MGAPLSDRARLALFLSRIALINLRALFWGARGPTALAAICVAGSCASLLALWLGAAPSGLSAELLSARALTLGSAREPALYGKILPNLAALSIVPIMLTLLLSVFRPHAIPFRALGETDESALPGPAARFEPPAGFGLALALGGVWMALYGPWASFAYFSFLLPLGAVAGLSLALFLAEGALRENPRWASFAAWAGLSSLAAGLVFLLSGFLSSDAASALWLFRSGDRAEGPGFYVSCALWSLSLSLALMVASLFAPACSRLFAGILALRSSGAFSWLGRLARLPSRASSSLLSMSEAQRQELERLSLAAKSSKAKAPARRRGL